MWWWWWFMVLVSGFVWLRSLSDVDCCQLIVRWKRDDAGLQVSHRASDKPILQFVSVRRKDSGEWALPGVCSVLYLLLNSPVVECEVLHCVCTLACLKYGCGLVPVSQQCNTLCISGFADDIMFALTPPPSSRHRLSYGDCLEDERENYQNCSVLCCVQQLCTVICTHIRAVLKVEYWFKV